MEEEAEKLKELQNEVEKQMNLSPPPGNAHQPLLQITQLMTNLADGTFLIAKVVILVNVFWSLIL